MINVIPKPLFCKENSGYQEINGKSSLYIAPELCSVRDILLDEFPIFAVCAENAENPDFAFIYDESLGDEEYYLCTNENKTVIRASGYAGALYAVETLKQILFFEKGSSEKVAFPCVEIKDKPRYKHRGLMLDEARHFFGKNECKRILSLMALYKLNVFHWHLTDDQGWRIEIKKYPLLTEIGSKRKDSQINGWRSGKLEGKPHSGFYTQEDIKEIVAYAEKLNITVIPEIDMPAHFASAIAAYNFLACREIKSEVHWFFGGHIPTVSRWFDYNRPACAGKESTYGFIFDVIDEIAELFPAPFFHIGGDEAPKNEWGKCDECKKRIKENNLAGTEELQGWFNNRIAEYLKKKGKRLIVWNEALSAGNLDREVIGQYWTEKRDDNVMKHIEKGGEVIICKHQAFYFDMCYSMYPLGNTYNFEATDGMVPEKYQERVLGLEGEMWTEWIKDEEKIDVQLFPRMLALSECCWSAKGDKSFSDFLTRKDSHEKMLDALGVNYAVDKVSMPKGFLRKKHEVHLWFGKDTDRDVSKNRELKKATAEKEC